MSRLRCRTLGLVVPVVALLAACGSPGPLETKDTVGERTGAIAVLIDASALTPVRCAMGSFLTSKRRGVKYGAGAPDQIATSVKNGLPTDAVVLPPGPALDRIRDELASPPLPLPAVSSGSTTFWVAAVTDRGLGFANFLAGRKGQAVLKSPPCARTLRVPAARSF
jgi:hypothetical protein